MTDLIDEIEKVEAIENEDSRTPRDLDSREASNREEPWIPASVLPVPTPQEGWVFRWIRVAMRNDPDNRNVSQKFREGWIPCKLEDHPELQVLPDIDNRFEGNVVVGGLMLCKNSKEKMDAKRKYHMNQSQSQMEAVDNNYMRENDARMPLLPSERNTRVTFGDGS